MSESKQDIQVEELFEVLDNLDFQIYTLGNGGWKHPVQILDSEGNPDEDFTQL